MISCFKRLICITYTLQQIMKSKIELDIIAVKFNIRVLSVIYHNKNETTCGACVQLKSVLGRRIRQQQKENTN